MRPALACPCLEDTDRSDNSDTLSVSPLQPGWTDAGNGSLKWPDSRVVDDLPFVFVETTQTIREGVFEGVLERIRRGLGRGGRRWSSPPRHRRPPWKGIPCGRMRGRHRHSRPVQGNDQGESSVDLHQPARAAPDIEELHDELHRRVALAAGTPAKPIKERQEGWSRG